MKLTPFHLAIQVRDIPEARDFYGSKLGFSEGRSSDVWVDFNMFGHQLVTHLNAGLGREGMVASIANAVDGDGVPVPHFGVVLELSDWEALAERVKGFVDTFIIEPRIRFKGEPGEQATMFFADPSGNALEFKAFRDIEGALFAK
ncbi:glyoxalase [Proteobacteria bacterium 005FR1]|nr:glyoxalase [Proteobacteria bacterium 005FR1]